MSEFTSSFEARSEGRPEDEPVACDAIELETSRPLRAPRNAPERARRDVTTTFGGRSARTRGRSPAHPAGHTLPSGDPERMGALLAELEPRMRAVALRYTRDPEVAKDVVQNACEKVLRHGSKFRGQSLVSTWIHRIVVNEALMWLRSEGRRRTLHEDEPSATAALSDPDDGPEHIVDLRQREAQLRELITALSREERDVVLRCALGGASYAEYGARMGIHPAAVKSRAFRARRRLEDAVKRSAFI